MAMESSDVEFFFGIHLVFFREWALGWPGGEVKVTKIKNQTIFLPLMALGNESPKEF